MDKIGRYEFLAEPFHCDFSGRLFMGHLGNHMLNAADFHSSARGFGMKYLMSINRSWDHQSVVGTVASGYRDERDAPAVHQVQCRDMG